MTDYIAKSQCSWWRRQSVNISGGFSSDESGNEHPNSL
jgi:hypothetical protein